MMYYTVSLDKIQGRIENMILRMLLLYPAGSIRAIT